MKAGAVIGTVGISLAAILSWSRNASIAWAIFHALCGWIYVIFFALTR